MAVKVEKQTIADRYALYCGDCCEVVPGLKSNSIGFSIFSPPFPTLYCYTDSDSDLGNSKNVKEFLAHFDFLVKELERVMMPGRVVAVHCMDLPTFKRNGEEMGFSDFPGDIIRCFQRHGFIYHCPRITIWKDPLIAATRTKALGLAHKQIVKDSSRCCAGAPDCIVAFRKKGDNPKPIEHNKGLSRYFGSRQVPRDLDRWIECDDPRVNKRSHWIWQQYASPVWTDIRQSSVLQFKSAREEDDERHICPLQIDVIERCMELWSMEDDIVLSPFAGVGSELYVALENNRRAIGVELKESYYRQALKNIRSLERKKTKSKGFEL